MLSGSVTAAAPSPSPSAPDVDASPQTEGHEPHNADDYTGNVFCDGCGDPWPCDTSALLDALETALDENARMREALEWIAHFDRAYLDQAKTLHYDLVGRAQQALAALLPEVVVPGD